MEARVVLLSDNHTEKMAKNTSLLIASKFPTLFTLDSSHIAHATLLHIEFDDRKLKQITAKIKNATSNLHKLKVETNQVKPDDITYIGIYFQDDEKIIKLREIIYEAIKDLIKNVAPLRSPHITFTRMKQKEDVNKVLNLLKDLPNTEIILTYVAICDSKENGICSKLFASYPLI